MAEKRGANEAARSDQEDQISALPDGVLEHILGFLPAHEVVRTSVLAPRWRHLWKSTRRLHITSPRTRRPWQLPEADETINFVSSFLLLRGHITLDEVKFHLESSDFDRHIDIWIRHALLCKAQVVTVHFPHHVNPDYVKLGDPPLVSRHLTRIELENVELEGKFLSFTSCPSLEVLKITDCHINLQRILSQSAKHLRIVSCTFECRKRTRIFAPSLVMLHLIDFMGTTPFLEAMPSLESASVMLDVDIEDICFEGDSEGCCGICANCCGDDDHKGSCVLLWSIECYDFGIESLSRNVYFFKGFDMVPGV